jgi:hypothetical protein
MRGRRCFRKGWTTFCTRFRPSSTRVFIPWEALIFVLLDFLELLEFPKTEALSLGLQTLPSEVAFLIITFFFFEELMHARAIGSWTFAVGYLVTQNI